MITNRISNLSKKLEDNNIDLLLVFKPENRKYLSGFTGTAGYVVLTKDKKIFATDFRYMEQANAQCEGYEIKELSTSYTIYDLINEFDAKRIGIEEDFITYQFSHSLTNNIDNIELIPASKYILDLRIIKDEKEIELIEKAAEITDNAFEHILNFIKPDMTESEVAIELEHFMKKQGATGPSFTFIVASGKRSSLPHGVASDKVIEIGDFVTIDMGCIYKGYCSDMTRTIVIGKANSKQKEIYDIVLKAQESALEAIKPGITGFDVDNIARNIIAENGYGKYFGHGLGHGVGLEVHEAPRLAHHDSAKVELKEGMVVTDEPGIYVPDFGGVRIEDLVVVTKDGYRVLSKSTKKLIELNF